MADMTNVDAQRLRQTASKVSNLAGDLSNNVGKINDALGSLAKGWQSDVATKFLQNWQADQEALKEMIEQYMEVGNLMNELANDYEASENEVQGLIGKLKI
ncbi:WXG100 family type VII secretion target [Butyrivibrio sp. ob235]|uniref:WXG100 family type VII secretion target n=1 Tax=Butyrivibrio sp. ob235 TaxID=1761780 RepID=UPI0008D1D199|nr:WXG100 family type VII secretion target [Butyrivibrio sp. ob235]SEM28581.1 WXG100 family type VII secretion target [Butyrivibrio sp. ob235]